MKKQKTIAIALTTVILIATYINSCNLVFATVYTVDYHRMPSEVPGDVTCDGKADIQDVARVSGAFGSIPGYPKWNPQYDIDENMKIDITDVAFVS